MTIRPSLLKQIVGWGFCALAVTPLLIGKTMYFPFITLKTFYARTIIEALFGIFAYLLLTTREIRVNKSWLFWAFTGWIAAIIIASLLGKDPYISFFSDYERSWGVLTVFHFYLLFIVGSSVLDDAQWKRFFNASILASIAVSIYGFGQTFNASWVTQPGIDRISSTLGNPTYVAIFLLYSIFFAALLATRSHGLKWKLYYIGVIVVDFIAFMLTAIRGATLGLFIASVLALGAYIGLSHSKKAKTYSLGALVALLAIVSFLYVNRATAWMAKIPYVNRVINISLEGATAQTRFIGWRAGLLGFKDNPILGVGLENYGVVFNKYFDAQFYNIAPTETFFDRAHNVTIDVLATTGIVGVITYFALFITFFIVLIQAYRKGSIDKHAMVLGGGVVVAYFVHSQFVFDDLISLTMFTCTAAYFARYADTKKIRERAYVRPQGATAAAVLIGVAAIGFIYVFNYLPYEANIATGYASSVDNFDASIESFKKALSYNTLESQDIRLALSDRVVQFTSQGQDPAKLKPAIDLAIQELEYEMSHSKEDVFIGIKLLSLYNLRGIITNDHSYLDKGEQFGARLITLSPQRLQTYYLLSETKIFNGKPDEAVELLRTALSYNSQYKDTYWFIGRAYLEAGNVDEGYHNLQIALDKGYRNVSPGPLISSMNKYVAKRDFTSMEKVYELIAPYTNDAQVYATLAAVEQQLGKNDKAIDYALKAAALDPKNYDAEARSFIDAIRKGTPAR